MSRSSARKFAPSRYSGDQLTVGSNDMKSTRPYRRQKPLSHALRSEWVSERVNKWAHLHWFTTRCNLSVDRTAYGRCVWSMELYAAIHLKIEIFQYASSSGESKRAFKSFTPLSFHIPWFSSFFSFRLCSFKSKSFNAVESESEKKMDRHSNAEDITRR